MKTFKQLLNEMPNTLHKDQSDMMLDDDDIKPPSKYQHEENYGGDNEYTLKGRSTIFPDWKKPSKDVHHWILHHDESNIAHMHTRGGTTKNGYFIANETAKHPDCKISAPEFYKMILNTGKVKGIQSGEQATEGGKSIWKRLSRDPELQVTHHDATTGKKIKLQPHWHWDSNYDHEKPTYLRVKLKK